MNDTNGGMFMALTSTFGDKEDAGTYVPQSKVNNAKNTSEI